MTTCPRNVFVFICKLLAPLPDGEVPVDEKRYLLDLCQEMKKRWYSDSKLLQIDKAKNMHSALVFTDGHHNAWLKYVDLIDRQMMIPAPRREQLKWKEARRKVAGGRPEWDAAIDRDRAWIARLDAAGVGKKTVFEINRHGAGSF